MGIWSELMSRLQFDSWYSARYRELTRLMLTLKRQQYNHLPHPFHQETESGGGYIPLSERRPSIIYPLPSIIARDVSNKLFSGRHFPYLTGDMELTESLEKLAKTSNLTPTMKYAAYIGSVGSVFISFDIIDKQFYFKAWESRYCEPVFDSTGELISVHIRYQCPVDALYALGYKFKNPQEWYWFGCAFTQTDHIVYSPFDETEPPPWNDWAVDAANSRKHNLGFVPGVWIYNITSGDVPDGICTFDNLLDLTVEIDYQLSQTGRGFKYSAAPQLAISGPSTLGIGRTAVIRSPSNYIELYPGSKDTPPGKAELLEMKGSGLREAVEYVKLLRAYALEASAGSRRDPERLTAIPMSGKAMELLDEDELDLIQSLRVTYGTQGLLPLLRKCIRAASILDIISNLSEDKLKDVDLIWTKVFLPSSSEIQQFAVGLVQAVQIGMISLETAADLFSIFLDLPHPIKGTGHVEAVEKQETPPAVPPEQVPEKGVKND
jgi:hypothetical protein